MVIFGWCGVDSVGQDCDMESGMVSGIVGGMVSGMVGGIVSGMVSGIVSGMVSGMISGCILQNWKRLGKTANFILLTLHIPDRSLTHRVSRSWSEDHETNDAAFRPPLLEHPPEPVMFTYYSCNKENKNVRE